MHILGQSDTMIHSHGKLTKESKKLCLKSEKTKRDSISGFFDAIKYGLRHTRLDCWFLLLQNKLTHRSNSCSKCSDFDNQRFCDCDYFLYDWTGNGDDLKKEKI